MADDDALDDDPESGADANPCRTHNLQAFLEKYGMLAVVVYGCISLGVFCLVYAALVFGVDAGPVLRYFGFSRGASEGTTVVLAIALTKLLVPVKLPLAAYIVVHISRQRERRRRRDDAELRGLLDYDDEDTRNRLFEELGEDELEKEEARAAAAEAPAIHV
jgi:hypothetical protein